MVTTCTVIHAYLNTTTGVLMAVNYHQCVLIHQLKVINYCTVKHIVCGAYLLGQV